MKDFFPKVSVLVPIKELEEGTYKSIDSILNQTYSNIEILLLGSKEIINT